MIHFNSSRRRLLSRNENLFAFSFHDCCRRLRLTLTAGNRERDDIDLEIKALKLLTTTTKVLLENFKSFVELMQGIGIKFLIEFFYCRGNFHETHKISRVHLQFFISKGS
jgi:hypothetical protein